MRTVNKIIIHCTATPEGRTTTVSEVTAWHRKRGFLTIGYHYLIGLNGEIWKGRDEHLVGSHCLGQNYNSIGICYVGGLSKEGHAKDTRTISQRQALKKLLKELMIKYPSASIHGHNEFSQKDCPCFNVREWCKIEGL